MVFVVLRASAIAEGIGGDEYCFQKIVPFANIHSLFISEHSMSLLLRVLCVASVADYFPCRSFFPKLQLLFGRYFIFENAIHVVISFFFFVFPPFTAEMILRVFFFEISVKFHPMCVAFVDSFSMARRMSLRSLCLWLR